MCVFLDVCGGFVKERVACLGINSLFLLRLFSFFL